MLSAGAVVSVCAAGAADVAVLGIVVLGAAGAVFITGWLMRRLGGEPDYATEIVTRIAAGDL